MGLSKSILLVISGPRVSLTFNQKKAHLPELSYKSSQWLIRHGQWHPPREWSGEKRSQFIWSVGTSLTISMSWILVRFNLDAYTLLGFLSWRIGAIAMMLVTMFQKGNMRINYYGIMNKMF